MKKLLFAAYAAMALVSCSKYPEIPTLPTKTPKGTTPIEMTFFSEGKDVRFFVKEKYGEWYCNAFIDSVLHNGSDAVFNLIEFGPEDEDGTRDEIGTCIVRLKFQRGTSKDTVNGTGTFVTDKGKGTLAGYINQGAGTLRYDLTPAEDHNAAAVINIYLKGYMRK